MKKQTFLLWITAGLLSASSVMAQEVLPEVVVTAGNYKYLRSIDNKDAAQPVKLLERVAAAYDVKSSDYYEEENGAYFISFSLPQGYILAYYDESGKLIRTAERFKNVALPSVVRTAVGTRYPNWTISNDIFLVKYEDASGARKVYKMLLRNGSKRLRIKTNDKGEFLD